MGDRSSKKVANSLLALSSAAVLAVYAAGYVRTRAAADRFALQAEGRRPAIPAPPVPAPPPSVVSSAPPAADPAPAAVPAAPRPARKKRARAIAPPAPTPASAAPVAPAPAPSVEPPAAAVESPPLAAPAAPAAPHYKDGTYLGWGSSRHGDIQAAVVIQDGRIESATIAQCLTRYSCSVIGHIPPQVAQRHSPEVDYVSGATQSVNAFYYAVVDALAKAK